jgi:hypothetical protein
MRGSRIALTTLALVLAACRPDPGQPVYSDADDFSAPFGEEEPLLGPEPYQEGIGRLAFGAFYEGRASQVIPVDDKVVHYYIFQDGAALTYTQSVSKDHVEGLVSARFSHAGGPWWGGGIFSDAPHDLTGWRSLHLSLKSSAPGFARVDVGMRTLGGTAVSVDAADYGYAADGEWHSLVIPLSDLVDRGLDLTAIDGFLVLGGFASDAGTSLLVDDFFLSQQP